MSDFPDIVALNFEDALAELERIVKQLESGSGKLDEAVRLYERGEVLRKHCERKLNEAQMIVEKLTQGGDGTLSATPFKTGQ